MTYCQGRDRISKDYVWRQYIKRKRRGEENARWLFGYLKINFMCIVYSYIR